MEIAAWANRCYIITPHQKRRFPERVRFWYLGWLPGWARPAATRQGCAAKARVAVVTDLGMLEPDENGELVLTALHPGVTVEQVLANTGWPLKVAAKLRITEPPSENELHILRDELDPQGIYLKGA